MKETSSATTTFAIIQPWGDSSLKLVIPEKPGDLSRHLNKLRLPPKFSAIWHRSTSQLEIIWTAFRLTKAQQALAGRSFDFELGPKTYHCAFRASSAALLATAKAFTPVGMTDTNHRNLHSFSSYINANEEGFELPFLDEPRSFWVSGVDIEEEHLVELVSQLNFYLTYFDLQSPTVIIHESGDDHSPSLELSRYPHGEFPSQISSINIDDVILSFWSAALNENTMLQFLLYYRIIEYAASQYLDAVVRSDIQKILAHPARKPASVETVSKIIDSLSLKKLEDIPRLKGVINQNVSTELLWQEISNLDGEFTSKTTFDGGFELTPLLSEKDSLDTFRNGKKDQFTDKLRQIRNALAHGKDLQSSGVITPTPKNMRLLEPWTHLIRIAAGEVAHYNRIS